jgi:hypothetical protein
MSAVDALVKTRAFIKARLTRLNTYFTSAKTKPAREVLGQVKTRLRTFTPSFEEFDNGGVTLGFYFGTGSKSSDLNDFFLMCYK